MNHKNLLLFLLTFGFSGFLFAQSPAQEADVIGDWEIKKVVYMENGVEGDNSGLLNLLEGNIYHYREDSLFSVSSFLAKEGQYPGKWYVIEGQIFEQSYFSKAWVESSVEKVDENQIRFISKDETTETSILMSRKKD